MTSFFQQLVLCVASFDMSIDCPEITGHVLFLQLSCCMGLFFIVLA